MAVDGQPLDSPDLAEALAERVRSATDLSISVTKRIDVIIE